MLDLVSNCFGEAWDTEDDCNPSGMTSEQEPIYVTKPHLPPLKDFIPYLEKIWQSGQLTNCGPMHEALECALKDYLGVPEIALFSSGTTALLTALQSMRIKGEVITTPYSFVATAHSLLWNDITPVFVDVDPVTLNLDPSKIEAAITPETTAILPVHCYGNPCDVAAFDQLAQDYNLKVVYDAAHAFGVDCNGSSVLNHGDLSTLSFHATKVFSTFEGGAIVCPDAKTKERIDRLKNFGFVDEVTVVASGINGKLNEVSAAFGLMALDSMDEVMATRANIDARYRRELAGINGISCVPRVGQTADNHAYFPIMVEEDFPLSRDELYEALKARGIFTRRYFYPLISNHPMYRCMPSANPKNLPVAHRAAEKVLCLPIYPGLSKGEQDRVIAAVNDAAIYSRAFKATRQTH